MNVIEKFILRIQNEKIPSLHMVDQPKELGKWFDEIMKDRGGIRDLEGILKDGLG